MIVMAQVAFIIEPNDEVDYYLRTMRLTLGHKKVPDHRLTELQRRVPQAYRGFHKMIFRGNLKNVGRVWILDIEPIIPKYHNVISIALFFSAAITYMATGTYSINAIVASLLGGGILFTIPEVFWWSITYRMILWFKVRSLKGTIHFLSSKQALTEVMHGAK